MQDIGANDSIFLFFWIYYSFLHSRKNYLSRNPQRNYSSKTRGSGIWMIFLARSELRFDQSERRTLRFDWVVTLTGRRRKRNKNNGDQVVDEEWQGQPHHVAYCENLRKDFFFFSSVIVDLSLYCRSLGCSGFHQRLYIYVSSICTRRLEQSRQIINAVVPPDDFVNNSTRCYCSSKRSVCCCVTQRSDFLKKDWGWYIKHYEFRYIDPE